MDWLAQNWIWVVLFALFIGMHLFGHGGGRDEQNPRAENSRAGSGRKATIKENRHAEHQARFLGARVVGHPLPDPAEQAASGVPPSSVVPRACAARYRREQHRLVHAGQEMNKNDWRTGFAKALAVFLNGGAIRRGPARRAGRRRQFLSPAHARGGGRLHAPAAAGFPAPGSCNVLEEASDGKCFRETSWPSRTGKAAARII